MSKVCVTAGCQGTGLALCLQELLPDSVISNVDITDFGHPVQRDRVRAQLSNSDYWLTIAGHDKVDYTAVNPKLKVVRIPQLWFGAFHPDLCYVRRASDGSALKPDYNSAIGIWAYKRSVDPARVSRLFNVQVFHELGYFADWERSVSAMRDDFARCDLGPDFNRFFLRVQRLGNFMHTLNHPKVTVLAELAKLIAVRLGADSSVLRRALDVSDDLASWGYWPLYPELARYYALPTNGYIWRNMNGMYHGIEAYIQHMHSTYEKQGVGPSEIAYLWKDADLYDRVLTAAYTAS